MAQIISRESLIENSIVERLCDDVMHVTLELLFDTRGSHGTR